MGYVYFSKSDYVVLLYKYSRSISELGYFLKLCVTKARGLGPTLGRLKLKGSRFSEMDSSPKLANLFAL